MVDLSSVVNDPSVNIIGQRAAISDNPFTAGQRFATNNQRELDIQRLLQSLSGNNDLRIALAQRLAAQESRDARLKNITGNIKDIAGVVGAVAAGDQAGFTSGGNAFSRARDPITIAEQQGIAQQAISGAIKTGAESGDLLVQSPEQFTGTGFIPGGTGTPLGEQEALAVARLPKLTLPGPGGTAIQTTPNAAEIEGFRTRSGLDRLAPGNEATLSTPNGAPRGLNREPRGGAVPARQTGVPASEAQDIKAQEVMATLSRVNRGRKTYSWQVRPNDRVAEVIETDAVTGEETVVLRFDVDGAAVSE